MIKENKVFNNPATEGKAELQPHRVQGSSEKQRSFLLYLSLAVFIVISCSSHLHAL